MSYEDYYDPISQLKEIYDKFEDWKPHIIEGGLYKYVKDGDDHKYIIYAFVGGDMKATQKNKMKIAEYSSTISKKDAQIQSSKIALAYMKKVMKQDE